MKMEQFDEKWMKKAIRLAEANISKDGGPFGAVVVKDGKMIAASGNQVTKKNDPTAHAEIAAIRKAAKKLNSFNLSGCEIYTSCEPCPMCLSAIYWARIDKIYYTGTQEDAKNAGFDDSLIYKELNLSPKNRSIPMLKIADKEALEPFKIWDKKKNKITY